MMLDEIKYACENNNTELLIDMLKSNKINSNIDYEKMFSYACYYNNISIVKLLIEYMEKINCKININTYEIFKNCVRDEWLGFPEWKGNKTIDYYIYLMKHNYGFEQTFVIPNYKTDLVMIQKKINKKIITDNIVNYIINNNYIFDFTNIYIDSLKYKNICYYICLTIL